MSTPPVALLELKVWHGLELENLSEFELEQLRRMDLDRARVLADLVLSYGREFMRTRRGRSLARDAFFIDLVYRS